MGKREYISVNNNVDDIIHDEFVPQRSGGMEEKMRIKKELKRYGISEYCVLEKEVGTIIYIEKKLTPGFTGLYFRDDKSFFAIYPTDSGPVAYFEGNEYPITHDLSITLNKDGEDRIFRIQEYGIEIDYKESPYIGMDIWSNEIDVDLFCMIEQKYRSPEFYEQYTLSDDRK